MSSAKFPTVTPESVTKVLDELTKLYRDTGKILFLDETLITTGIPTPNPLDIHIEFLPVPGPPVFDMPQVDRTNFVLEKVQVNSCSKSRNF